MAAKELKNKTGEAIRTVSKGRKVLITLRGKPFALILPVTTANLEKSDLRPIDTAWTDIENTLKRSKPEFKNLKEAMDWTRRRGSDPYRISKKPFLTCAFKPIFYS
ncbi:MAG: type II toxin-antitoxin system prevent-host-death family antitoxin [Thermodesulfovibrionia bacterium]|nr:type II toxin-antitoxin system prevent-host-death family antitoxin [Thermodesulfovibrionia bacterium]